MKLTRPDIEHLDRDDTIVLKGLAILAIVLHNFFHFINPAQQNEFVFHPGSFGVFLREVSQPTHSIQAFFSFFGHFGVQIFMFLSAYGLAKSHWTERCTWTHFMAGRIRKLYPTVLVIVIPWLCLMMTTVGPHRFFTEVAPPILAMLLGVSTLMGFGLPPVGPWWFIPFIVQFYALWFFLRAVAKRFGSPGLLTVAAGCLLMTYLADPFLSRWSVNLLMTPIGRMPVICFGIAAARLHARVPAVLAASGLAAGILGSMYRSMFPFTFIGMLLVSLWMYMQCRGLLRRSRLLVRIGECSMLIFLLNGIVRDYLVGKASGPASQLYWGFLSAALTIAIANLIARLLEPRVAVESRRIAASENA